MRNPLKPKVMCTIDSLFDFRLSALMLTQTNVFMEGIRGSLYCNRLSDDYSDLFPGYQKDAYLKRINNLDSELMKFARLTNVAYFLAYDAELVDDNIVLNPQFDNMIFHLNIHPFVLTPAAEDIIINVLRQILSASAEIELVSYSIIEMTPDILSEYETLFIYNYTKWISEHHQALIKRPLPNLNLHAPTLEINKLDGSGTNHQEEVLSGIHRFKFLENMTADYFRLRFLDTATFSVITKT